MYMLGHQDKRMQLISALAAMPVERLQEKPDIRFNNEQSLALPRGERHEISSWREVRHSKAAVPVRIEARRLIQDAKFLIEVVVSDRGVSRYDIRGSLGTTPLVTRCNIVRHSSAERKFVGQLNGNTLAMLARMQRDCPGADIGRQRYCEVAGLSPGTVVTYVRSLRIEVSGRHEDTSIDRKPIVTGRDLGEREAAVGLWHCFITIVVSNGALHRRLEVHGD